MSESVIGQIRSEEGQLPQTRAPLFRTLERSLKRPVLAFFTSFVHPVSISQIDVDILESILQSMDLSKGLAIMISSPGGDGIAAERIIGLCRQYSGTGEYWA